MLCKNQSSRDLVQLLTSCIMDTTKKCLSCQLVFFFKIVPYIYISLGVRKATTSVLANHIIRYSIHTYSYCIDFMLIDFYTYDVKVRTCY